MDRNVLLVSNDSWESDALQQDLELYGWLVEREHTYSDIPTVWWGKKEVVDFHLIALTFCTDYVKELAA